MYLGRYKRGDWVPLRHAKVRAGPNFTQGAPTPVAEYPIPHIPDWSATSVTGVNDPTLSVFAPDGTQVVTDMKMYQLDTRLDPSLYTVELFLGDDIPEDLCTVRLEYSAHNKRNSILTANYGDMVMLWTMRVLPSGNSKGSYLESYVYNRPNADFLLGQYDNDSLDFRRNPRR